MFCLLFFSFMFLFCFSGIIIPVNALSWDDWTDKAGGDYSMSSFETYWTVESTPKPGYEHYLWDSWEDVIDTQLNYDDNHDKML